MNLFQSLSNLSLLVKLKIAALSSHQDYARQHGFILSRLNDFEWALSNSEGLVRLFPNQQAASHYIYQLEMEAVAQQLN
jgi:hypothetical protein